MLPRAARKKNYPTVDISRAGCSRWCVRRNRPSLERVSSTGRLPDYDSTRKGQQGGGGDVGEEGLGEGGEGGRLLTKVRVDDEEVEGRQQGACKKPERIQQYFYLLGPPAEAETGRTILPRSQ